MNFFVLEGYPSIDFIEAIKVLSKGGIAPGNFIYLLRILDRVHDSTILKLLQNQINEIPNQIMKQTESWPYLFNCSCCNDINISKFASQVLTQVVNKNPLLIPRLQQVIPVLNSMSNGNPEITALLQEVSQQKNQEKEGPTEQNPFNLLRSILSSSVLFKDTIFLQHLKNLGPKPSMSIVSPRRQTTHKRSSAHLSIDSFSTDNLDESPVESMHATEQSVLGSYEAKEPLRGYARKKGGATKKAFQTRFFEFDFESHCLIWRNSPQQGDIKGILFLGKGMRIYVRGYSIFIETKKKTHEINFDPTANIATPKADFSEWTIALEKAAE